MKKNSGLLLGTLAALTALMMTGCHWNEDPVRQSLDIETSDLALTVGQSASRPASTESKVSNFIYTSSKPSVALVDQNGQVTAMSEGEAVIKVHMDETREGWYAAADREYKVIVKSASAEQLRAADKNTPLTLVAQADGKITINFKGGITLASDITYSVNGGAEQTISKSTEGAYDISVKKDDVVQLYSTNTALSSGVTGARGETRAVADGAKYVNIKPSMKTEIYGNLMSLLKGKDNYKSATAIEGAYAFYGLFAGAENLVNNLLRHPELPATTLKEGCYEDMFYGCKGLSRAPDLPAEALTKNCYKEMFADCSKLSYVKLLATSISVEGCTKNWLANAGSAVTSEKKVMSVFYLPTDSNDGVPTGWTNVLINPVESVTLDKADLLLGWGGGLEQTATLKATVNPPYANDSKVSWSSNNETVATVDQNGLVTAKTAGVAIITATAGGKSATCTVIAQNAFYETDLSTLATNYTVANNGEILKGTLANNVQITIPDGFTVVLKDVNINGNGTWTAGDYAGITCAGDAAILFVGTNVVKGFDAKYPGISVPENKTLTLIGGEMLKASSNGQGAGIGGGKNIDCGNIVIAYGTVEAIGGGGAAGIGGGEGGSCGNITISSDVSQLTATKGSDAPYSIGKGKNGSCGTVTIGNSGESNYITNSNSGVATSPYGYPYIDLSTVTGTYDILENETLTGTLGTDVVIRVGDNHINDVNLTLDNVNISRSTITLSDKYGIGCFGDVTIILKGENKVEGSNFSGIFIEVDKTLTIKGDGKLTARSIGQGAGIGGAIYFPCGRIKIESGIIDAVGAEYCAGIGAGYNASCKDIVISGGTITATGKRGAGIGGGHNSIYTLINISGGNINANGGNDAAGIGGGPYSSSACGNIYLTGGKISAMGVGAAAIGCGKESNVGNIMIDSTVEVVFGSIVDNTNDTYTIGRSSHGAPKTVSVGGKIYYEDGFFRNDGHIYLGSNPFTYHP